MIARLWSARATPEQIDAYLHHFEKTVHPELRNLKGFLGSTVCVRPSPGIVEILVTTYWHSFEAIGAFAGTDRESAVVAAEAAALLADYDKSVRHYEVAANDFPRAR